MTTQNMAMKTNLLTGQKKWYADFMTKKIKDNGTYIGLDPKVYSLKPVHMEDFAYSVAVPLDDNPDNIFEEIRFFIKAITKSVEKITAETRAIK